jgi:hypothetical protein
LALRFTATLFVGRGEYLVEKRPTVLAAMEAASAIESDARAHTRRALIYAIGRDGHATLLTAARSGFYKARAAVRFFAPARSSR